MLRFNLCIVSTSAYKDELPTAKSLLSGEVPVNLDSSSSLLNPSKGAQVGGP